MSSKNNLIPKFQHPWRAVTIDRNQGTWGNRGQGNELQSAFEKGTSWIVDKIVNAGDYMDQGLAYVIGLIPGGLTAEEALLDKKNEQEAMKSGLLGYVNAHGNYEYFPITGIAPDVSIAKLPGWLLKGLMRGSQLEKLLSKAGTININGLLAYLNKASKLELDVIGKVLNNQFAGLKNIDYNALRKAVLDELIIYNRVPQDAYATYGMDRLGFKKETDPGLGPRYDYVPGVNTQTYTFESPRIPRGNDKHYDITTLGHSRTYTTPDEPDILHVMESLSDWAQNFKKYHGVESNYDATPDPLFGDILSTTYIPELHLYLSNNYLPRQLQENMKFAAEQGQKKMRYPTSNTAAKIEGFRKTTITDPKFLEEYRALDLEKTQLANERFDLRTSYLRRVIIDERLELIKLREQELDKIVDYSYSPEHQVILKKYEDFPKMFNKLFKGLEVRTVTDPKGNTWYEVDIPENFLLSEWLFLKGGILGISTGIYGLNKQNELN